MATEYTLRLKAVLDTADVQAKIAQLNTVMASSGSSAHLGGASTGLNTLNTSLNNLSKSVKSANAEFQTMIKTGAVLAAAHSVGNIVLSSPYVAPESMSYFNDTLKFAGTGAAAGAGIGAMVGGVGAIPGGIAGALIGAITGITTSILHDLVNSDAYNAVMESTRQQIPLIGGSLGGLLEAYKDTINKYSAKEKQKLEEEAAKMEEALQKQNAEKRKYLEKQRFIEELNFVEGISKMSDSELASIVNSAYKSKKNYKDLFDTSSEAYQKILNSTDSKTFYTALNAAIADAEKQLNKDAKRATVASKEVERRYENEWSNDGFGPMTNFSKMGLNFGENEINSVLNKQLNVQEQELEVTRRIFDLLARGQNIKATFS